jgi:hypothetical protein
LIPKGIDLKEIKSKPMTLKIKEDRNDIDVDLLELNNILNIQEINFINSFLKS